MFRWYVRNRTTFETRVGYTEALCSVFIDPKLAASEAGWDDKVCYFGYANIDHSGSRAMNTWASLVWGQIDVNDSKDDILRRVFAALRLYRLRTIKHVVPAIFVALLFLVALLENEVNSRVWKFHQDSPPPYPQPLDLIPQIQPNSPNFIA